MDEHKTADYLQRHGVRPTANRIVIVKALAAAHKPLSMKDLERQILSIDKSNISRTLSLFRAQDVVHTIEDGDGIQKYELCMSHGGEGDDDEHTHFFCEQCHKLICLYDMPTPEVTLAGGFRVHAVNVLVKGLCPECVRKVR